MQSFLHIPYTYWIKEKKYIYESNILLFLLIPLLAGVNAFQLLEKLVSVSHLSKYDLERDGDICCRYLNIYMHWSSLKLYSGKLFKTCKNSDLPSMITAIEFVASQFSIINTSNQNFTNSNMNLSLQVSDERYNFVWREKIIVMNTLYDACLKQHFPRHNHFLRWCVCSAK